MTNKKKLFISTIFFLTIIIGILQSKVPILGWYYLLKIGEYLFICFYIAAFYTNHVNKSLFFLSLGVLFESILAITQYVLQHSVNSIFYFLGERMYSGQTPGIANASLHGALVVRPYGTFSHPNVLAGYLIIIMTILIFNFQFSILNQNQKYKFSISKMLLLTSLLMGTVGLFLTLSRVPIVVWIIVIGCFVFIKIKRKTMFSPISHLLFPILILLLSLFFFSPLFYRFTQLTLGDEAVVFREELAGSAIAMIQQHPVFGVGLHNFLVVLPSFEKIHAAVLPIQPVHNIFLLIGAETGIPGLVVVLWGVYKIISNFIHSTSSGHEFQISNFKVVLLLEVIILGMFDHYFLTLQQGQLLLSFVIGLCLLSSGEPQKGPRNK